MKKTDRGEGMKKWIGIIVVSLLVVVSVGYIQLRPRLPELTVKLLLEKLEESNYDPILDSDEIELTDEQRELVEQMLESFTYEIKGSRIEGKMAYVELDISFIDLEQLIYEQRETLLKNTLENFWSTLEHVLNGRTKDYLMQMLLSLLSDESIIKPMKQKTIEVPLQKESFFWVPQITQEWIESVFGLEGAKELLEPLQQQ